MPSLFPSFVTYSSNVSEIFVCIFKPIFSTFANFHFFVAYTVSSVKLETFPVIRNKKFKNRDRSVARSLRGKFIRMRLQALTNYSC